jgi:hypothetical protein
MPTTLPLRKMTTAQKLMAMEELWSDLADKVDDMAPPAWQLAAVRATDERIKAGKEGLIEWSEAKRSLRRRAK